MQVLSERTVSEAEDERLAVRKAVLDLGRDNVSGIKLTIRSRSDRPLAVRVEEELPDQLSESDVQIHPGYNPEKWTVSKTTPRMVFADELPPSGEVETIYGVRMDLDDLELLAGAPIIAESRELAEDEMDSPQHDPADEVTGPDRSSAASGGDSGQDASAGGPGGDSSPGLLGQLDGEPAASDDTPAADATAEGSSEADDTAGSSDAAFVYGETRSELDGEAGDGGPRQPEAPPAEPSIDDGAISGSDPIQAFVEAIERGDLSEDHREAIREALDLGPDRRGGTQLDSLRSAVAKHSAFADEFEDLVDAVGSPVEAITDLRTAVERLDGDRDVPDQLEELATEVREGAADRAELGERLDELADDVRSGADERDELSDRLAELTRETRVEAIERGKLRPRLEDLEDRVEAIANVPTAGEEAIGELGGRVDDLTDEVRAAADHRTELHDRVDEYVEVTREMVEAWDDLRDFSDELWRVSRAVAETQELLGTRFDELNRGFERLQEAQETSIDRLDGRVSDLEAAFESDEAGAIREVIAAERRWREQHEGSRSPPDSPPSRSQDP